MSQCCGAFDPTTAPPGEVPRTKSGAALIIADPSLRARRFGTGKTGMEVGETSARVARTRRVKRIAAAAADRALLMKLSWMGRTRSAPAGTEEIPVKRRGA